MRKPRLLLLLGSGASPAPKVKALTESVLDDRMQRHSCGRWIPRKVQADASLWEALVLEFLRLLRGRIALWRDCSLDDVTYEDIGAVLSDLWKERSRRNLLAAPALRAFEEEFGPRAAAVLCRADLAPKGAFFRLVEDSKQRVHWSVVCELSKEPLGGTKVFETILSGLLPQAGEWTIATLNHDLLIERALRRARIPFSDGFAMKGGVRSFSPARLRSSKTLLKLHGGVDWRWHPDYRAIVRVVDESDHEAIYASEKPEFLIGTYTKAEDYSYGIFPKLFAAFDRALEAADHIIVSGYGFRDAGVNSRLIAELQFSTQTKLTIIHHDPESLIRDAPGHAAHFLRNLPVEVFFQRRFEELATAEGLASLRARLRD